MLDFSRKSFYYDFLDSEVYSFYLDNNSDFVFLTSVTGFIIHPVTEAWRPGVSLTVLTGPSPLDFSFNLPPSYMKHHLRNIFSPSPPPPVI